MKGVKFFVIVQAVALLMFAHAINAQSSWQKLADFNNANAAVWMDAGTSKNYIITSDRWIYYTPSGSDTWIPFADVPSFYSVGSIKASKVTNRVFCLSMSNGIVYTDNLGVSWQSNGLSSGGGNSGFGALVLAYGINGTKLLASTIGPVSGEIQNNLFVSTDNGSTFAPQGTIPFYPTGFHFLGASEVLSNTADGIFKTANVNSGIWTQIGFDGLEVTDIEVSNTTVFASVIESGEGKVYKSIDSGATWSELSGLLSNTNVSKLAYDPTNDRLYATTKSGVFVYNGAAWTMVSANTKAHEIIVTGDSHALFSGVRVNGIHKIGTDNSVLQINDGLFVPSDFMVVTSDNQLYSGSLNTSFLSKLNLNNLSWTSETLMEDIDDTRILSMRNSADGQCLIGGTHFIAKTADQGTSILSIADDATAPLAPVYEVLFPQKMFSGNNGSVSMVQHSIQNYVDYSPDMGTTWNHLYENNGTNPGLLSLEKVCSGTQTHFILGMSNMTAQNIVIYSTNEGAAWTTLPAVDATIRNIFVDRFDRLYAVTHAKLFSWNPISQSWFEHNINLGSTSSNKVVEVAFDYNNKLYVLVRSTTTPFAEEGFYVSDESGTSFTQKPFPTGNGQPIPLKNLAFTPDNIPLAMSNLAVHDFEIEGVYFYSDEPFLSVAEPAPIQQTVVYPNPANGIVHISNPEGLFSATLVNMRGQIIPVEITNGSFDVSGISNGIYVLRLQTANRIYNLKLVVGKQ